MSKVNGWVHRSFVVSFAAITGLLVIVPAASAAEAVTAAAPPHIQPMVESGVSWFPPGVYAKLDGNETSELVQVGAVAAAAYVSAKMPTPVLKVAAAGLGAALWLTARDALNSADRKCVVISSFVGLGSRISPTPC